LQWVSPFDAWEAREIGIGGDQLTAVFTGQGGQVRVCHKVRDGLALDQHPLKDDPVPVGRINDARARLIQPALHTGKRLIERQRALKDTRIRADPDEGAEDGPAKTHRRGVGQLRIPPLARHRMVGTLLVFCIQQDVGIHKDHR